MFRFFFAVFNLAILHGSDGFVPAVSQGKIASPSAADTNAIFRKQQGPKALCILIAEEEKSLNVKGIEERCKNGRRLSLGKIAWAGLFLGGMFPTDPAAAATARIDVNNALAREYTAFPGLFPTVATKIVKGGPYTSKKEVYAVLNEMEQERLKTYDKAIVINKPDAQLKQFKTSQICKYECGNRVSSSYQDEQIKAVQKARRSYD